MNSSTRPKMLRYWCAADLVEHALLDRAEHVDCVGPNQILGHEIAREIQVLVLGEDVVELQAARKDDASVAS